MALVENICVDKKILTLCKDIKNFKKPTDSFITFRRNSHEFFFFFFRFDIFNIYNIDYLKHSLK